MCLQGLNLSSIQDSALNHDLALLHFTTCLPVPWRGWGPLVRSKQAVFRVLDFERIDVLGCLATIVEEARSIRKGSNSAH